MADGIDEAARAFETELKGEPVVHRPNKIESNDGPSKRMFGNVGELEIDDESPEKGGGDDDEDEIYREETPDKQPPRKGDDDDEEGPDDAEEPEEEGEEDEDTKEFLGQSVQVVVDGEEKTVTVKEALEGYVRTETFHKRLNELDEAKKIVQRAAADAAQNYQYTMQVGQEIEAHLSALIPQEPNWDEEFQKNPARARELQKYYEQVRGFRQTMREKMTEATNKQAESDRIQTSTFAEAEARKFDQANSKNWATDPKKKGKDLQAMRRTALTQGFSEEEISQVYDSRMLMVLLKASKYDRMMAAKPKPVPTVRNKPIAPGTGSAKSRTVHRGVSSAMKRLNRSGSIEDAAVVMDELIRRGG
jgi:hypothetical protein